MRRSFGAQRRTNSPPPEAEAAVANAQHAISLAASRGTIATVKRGGRRRIEKGLRYFAIPLTEVRQMYIGGGVVALIIIILLLVWLL